MAETLAPGDPALAARLERIVEGDVRFDAFTRGLYSTDASHYQIEPIGVVFPKSSEDVEHVLAIAREAGVPVLPRGGGTSQCGQTIGRAIVIDTSRYLTAIGDVRESPDGAHQIEVEPGVILDHLNAALRDRGLWFPVDPSTGSRATLGGMAGNNSAGARSLRYGMMVDNVEGLDLVLSDGRSARLGYGTDDRLLAEHDTIRALVAREADEIRARRPRTMRNVAGYNLDRLVDDAADLTPLFIGSEGSLGFFTKIRLRLSPLPRKRVLGVCHFPDLYRALDSVQHLVSLEPSAVELVDGSVLRLAAERPLYRRAMEGFVQGEPGSLLAVEFATESEDADLMARLSALEEMLGALGYPDSVVRAVTPAEQQAVWSVRKAGLNIVMSMAGPRKPISFIEDCAVPLEHLAEYAEGVEEIFGRHGVDGTWYAHASVGCLHVRPAVNLKDPEDVKLVRSIAEETHELVARLDGTHSGEHGDGILRSEFLEPMLGSRMTTAFSEVKRTFDPSGLMNPGKIVDPPRMDDRSLFRYPPEYAPRSLPVVMDWSATGGMLGAAERCNNNGACRKYQPEVMCPSFRVTHDERHSTRGRANALRLALTNQLGASGLDSPEMEEAMSLCVSCKGCRRECPTGVDMARLKLEWQHHRNRSRGVPLRERVLAAMPRIASRASALSPLVNLAQRLPVKGLVGIAPERSLPTWHADPWRTDELPRVVDPEVVLFVDTFTRWLEPEPARAAKRVLRRGDWSAMSLEAQGRPYCCGRTYLSAGMLDEARMELTRLVDVLAPYARGGAAIVGLEPSCLYTLRDEAPALVQSEDAEVVAQAAMMLEEFVDREWGTGRRLPFRERTGRALVHGHCHQKALGGDDATLRVLNRIPGFTADPIESSCCGMAGAFGYHREHYDVSMAMGELTLFPALRDTDAADDAVIANGTSCRAQIGDGTGRTAVHSAIVMAEALPSD